jgi:cell fate regulator YaaT (PSP1 superfamily)
MQEVVGIKFRNSAKVYYFSPNGHNDLEVGEYVIVETVRGQEAGTVAFAVREVDEEEIPGHLKGILRRATALDLTQMERFQQKEADALCRCREQVAEHKLLMKVIRAEYNFSGSYLTFYFTAEKRVDFRALVKELARIFQSRIELRQVGVRDEVRLLGGYGLCGRPHCCSTWMTEFRPISIRMAKQQNLPLSPMEISGVCGRLLCCLAYENDAYAEVKKRMPRRGSRVQTPQGLGQVIGLNVLQESVDVRLEGDVKATFELSELGAVVPDSGQRSGSKGKGRRKRG